MFLINIKYKVSFNIIDQYLKAHRDFLALGYKKNYFVVSGPKVPRDGGIIISQLKDQDLLQKFLEDDPFLKHNLAEYEIIAFDPVKFHPDFSVFLT